MLTSPIAVAGGPGPVDAGSILVDITAIVTVTFVDPIPSTIPGEQYRLSSVDGNVTGNPSSILNIADGALQIVTANYVLQDNVVFTASANVLGDSSATIVTSDSFSYTLGVNTAGTTMVSSASYAASALPYKVWVDDSTPIAYSFASPVASSTSPSTIQYVWSSTSGLDMSQSDSFTVLSPGTVTGNYVSQAPYSGLSPGFWKHNIGVYCGTSPGSYSSPQPGLPHETAASMLSLATTILSTHPAGVPPTVTTASDFLFWADTQMNNPALKNVAPTWLTIANWFNAAAGYTPYP